MGGTWDFAPGAKEKFLGLPHGPRNMFDLRLARAKDARQQGQEAEGKRPKRRKGKGHKAKTAGQRHRRKNVSSFTRRGRFWPLFGHETQELA